MSTKVYVSTIGEPVDPDLAKISVFDRGFLYGDSVYETMRTAGGTPLELDRHLTRLDRSAAAIGLVVPFSHAAIAEAIARTHRASDNEESYVRVMVTRGVGPLMLDPRRALEPTLVILAQPLSLPSAEMYDRGISVVVVDARKVGSLDPGIKTGNYLANIQALREAIERGGDDALLCNAKGNVAEGATSNVFCVIAGAVVTPPREAGILPGITREVVCELAKDLGLQERSISPDELRGADEVFLTSSVRGIMPVTRVDGAPVGDGRVGRTTSTLRARYERYIESSATTA